MISLIDGTILDMRLHANHYEINAQTCLLRDVVNVRIAKQVKNLISEMKSIEIIYVTKFINDTYTHSNDKQAPLYKHIHWL